MKILIVEDEIITATDLKETLENHGFNIPAIARNYDEAIRFTKRDEPDIVIIDVQLKESKEDGIEVARFLSEEAHIPFVFLTANSESETYQKASVLKPAAYLLKPYRHKELALQIDLAYRNYQGNILNKNDPYQSDSLFLPFQKGYQRIEKNEVILLSAGGSYAFAYLKGIKSPLKFSMNLGYLTQFFTQPNFIQVSRSHLINLNYIDRFDADFIYLKNIPERISLAQNRKQEFLKRIAIVKTQ